MINVGRNIKRRRLDMKPPRTQTECANELGVNRVWWCLRERDDANITMASLKRIAGVLKCSPAYLLKENK